MRRLKGLQEKVLLLSGFAAIILAARLLKLPCVWLFLTGIPCPGCGMTRACLAALQLDFAAAFSYHMMFWSIPVLLIYFFLDGRVFKHKIINRAVLAVIAVGFFINWMVKVLHVINL